MGQLSGATDESNKEHGGYNENTDPVLD